MCDECVSVHVDIVPPCLFDTIVIYRLMSHVKGLSNNQ